LPLPPHTILDVLADGWGIVEHVVLNYDEVSHIGPMYPHQKYGFRHPICAVRVP
jgi:hypothetical protein